MKFRITQGGFILVATLWVIAALSLVVAMATSWVSESVDRTLRRRNQIETDRLLFSTQSELLYLISTQYFSNRGLEIGNSLQARLKQMLDPMAALELGQTFIALDNRPYKLNGVTVQFQDSRGLINLNFASQDDIYRLLGSVNVPAEDRGPLIAKLKDYMEPGDLIRLNGAKTPDYLAAGKLPPSGAPLSTPWEIWRVLDWDQQDALRDPSGSWFQSTSTTRSVGINLNTAPEAVLDIIQGMTPNAVKALMDYRAQTPLQNTNQAQALTGVGFTDDPLHYIMFPADSLRVTMKAKGGYNMTRTFAVSVTPQSTQGPWRIDFMIDLPSKSTNETDQDTDIPDLPTSPLVSAGP